MYFSQPQNGLFEDIAEGIKQAKVFIACVSDEVGMFHVYQMR